LGHRVRGLQIRSTTSHLCTCARVHVGGVGLSHKRVGGAIAPTGCGGFRC
jgi:hypothetical protein